MLFKLSSVSSCTVQLCLCDEQKMNEKRKKNIFLVRFRATTRTAMSLAFHMLLLAFHVGCGHKAKVMKPPRALDSPKNCH